MSPGSSPAVVVVGAGIVGAACAQALAEAGVHVTIVDRGPVGSGTTSRGEGNVLVSDKGPGAELELARWSQQLWLRLSDEIGRDAMELDTKGGLVVAQTSLSASSLLAFADAQAAAGVLVEQVDDPRALEPHLAEGVLAAVHYPEDLQVQPVLAASALLAHARRSGASFRSGIEVVGALRDPTGRLSGVRTSQGETIPADFVVNAAGTWGGVVGERLGASIPVLPRRGFILVTEPLPPMVRHKVYSADYVDNVGSSSEGLETSCVVEGTRGGTILIGASRERVGFDLTLNVDIVKTLSRQAISLFPFLEQVNLMRVYRGFRPYCPDHLPVIGPDPRDPGLIHACGHEGAGIGLAPATARLVTDYVTGMRSRETDDTYAALLADRLLGPTTGAVA